MYHPVNPHNERHAVSPDKFNFGRDHIGSLLVQDCSNPIANALE